MLYVSYLSIRLGKELLEKTEKKIPLGTEFLNKCIIHKRKNL